MPSRPVGRGDLKVGGVSPSGGELWSTDMCWVALQETTEAFTHQFLFFLTSLHGRLVFARKRLFSFKTYIMDEITKCTVDMCEHF